MRRTGVEEDASNFAGVLGSFDDVTNPSAIAAPTKGPFEAHFDQSGEDLSQNHARR